MESVVAPIEARGAPGPGWRASRRRSISRRSKRRWPRGVVNASTRPSSAQRRSVSGSTPSRRAAGPRARRGGSAGAEARGTLVIRPRGSNLGKSGGRSGAATERRIEAAQGLVKRRVFAAQPSAIVAHGRGWEGGAEKRREGSPRPVSEPRRRHRAQRRPGATAGESGRNQFVVV